ncbi:MAG: ABC transporter permease [Deltaproteobacteria bacterium]|nr:ABC transporter permease [Candidatus Anaeroferrophillacea bacterium]
MKFLRHVSCQVRSTWRNIHRHLAINAVSIVTITFSLVLFGLYGLATGNVMQSVSLWQADLEMVVYLDDDVSGARLEELKTFCREQHGVAAVHYTDKEEALKRFRRTLGAEARLLEGLTENPLPASLELKLSDALIDAASMDDLAVILGIRDGVAEIRYSRQWLAHFFSLLRFLRLGGMAVTGFLFMVTVIIVSNTIKLSFYARLDAIGIMELVGATKFYIAVPYLLEGMFQGAVAAVLALAALYGLFRYLAGWLHENLAFLAGTWALRFFSPLQTAGFLALGIMLGVAGFLITFRWLKSA